MKLTDLFTKRVISEIKNNPEEVFNILRNVSDVVNLGVFREDDDRIRLYIFWKNLKFILKIGKTKLGTGQNLRERQMSNVIYPFCTQCYDCTDDGKIALFEYVDVL